MVLTKTVMGLKSATDADGDGFGADVLVELSDGTVLIVTPLAGCL